MAEIEKYICSFFWRNWRQEKKSSENYWPLCALALSTYLSLSLLLHESIKQLQFIIYFVEVYTMFSNKLLMCKLILFGSLPQMFWRHCSSWFLKKLLREEWLIVLNLLKQQLDRFKTTSEFESTYLQENKKSPLSWLTSNFIYWASLGFSIKKLNFSIMHPKLQKYWYLLRVAMCTDRAL